MLFRSVLYGVEYSTLRYGLRLSFSTLIYSCIYLEGIIARQAMNYNVALGLVLATIVTYSECMCVELGIQHAVRMRHIVICELLGSTIFFSYLINGTIKKNSYRT